MENLETITKLSVMPEGSYGFCLLASDQLPDRLEKMGLQIVDFCRLPVQNGAVAAGADQLHDHKKKHLGIPKGPGGILKNPVYIVEIHPGAAACGNQLILEDGPAQILGYKVEEGFVILELLDDVVDHKDHPLIQPCQAGFQKSGFRHGKNLGRLVGDQLVADVILVPEIEVKGSLGHACRLHDIVDGGFGDALGDKQLKGRIQESLPLLLFVQI